MDASNLISALKELSKSDRKKEDQEALSNLFQTQPGGYGEHDLFLNIRVPAIRKLAEENHSVSLEVIKELIQNKYHEVRLLALFIGVEKMNRPYRHQQLAVVKIYLDNIEYVNNWDLVDSSAHKILGRILYERYSFGKALGLLDALFDSGDLWSQRIAIVSGFYFIKQKDYRLNLHFAEQLVLGDQPHDLLQKASGWMLREIGKRDQSVLTLFLDRYADRMPRTMLRYSIERLDESARQNYLNLSKSL